MVGVDTHKKAAYYFALKVFCTRNLKYEPELWDFVISQKMVTKWEALCSISLREKNVAIKQKSERGEGRHSGSCIVSLAE